MGYFKPDITQASSLVLGIILATSTLTACADSHASGRKIGDEQGRNQPTDPAITSWAETALRQDPRVSSSDIKVGTSHGIVTLEGTVDSIQARNDAKQEVQKISGVQGVIDELTVRPASRKDSAIEEDVVRRLTHSPGVRCDGLVVHVAGGTVTLHGRVASWNELEYATLLAGEVRGVQHVNNRMKLSFREPRTDQENLDEIVAAIESDPYLTGLPIAVRVSDSVATLEGTVGNAYEKERAENDALTVSSVISVKNRLEINWPEEDGVREDLPVMSDDQILLALRTSLNQDRRITNPDEIRIEVADRAVTLTGSVPDYYQDAAARQNARDTVGVEQVFDSLNVDPADRNDDEIRSELSTRLDTDYALAGRGIVAYVEDGVVTLEGQVRNSFERDHADYIATTVLGVRSVVNDIVVQPVVGYSDEALKESIEGRLEANWKTRHVAPRIHVTVEDGSATLTGEVDTWAERLEAGQMSRSVEGVIDVANNLTLADH